MHRKLNCAKMNNFISFCHIISCIMYVTSGNTVCKDGWIGITNMGEPRRCFKVFTEQVLWNDAVDKCRAENSYVMNPDDLFTTYQPSIVSTIQLQINLALSQSNVGTFWTGLCISGHKFWWDGIEPKAPNFYSMMYPRLWTWKNGHLNITTNWNLCAWANQRASDNILELTLSECDEKRPFICMNKGFSIESEEGLNGCEPGWYGNVNSDKCLYYDSSGPKTFEEAREICRIINSYIVSPNMRFDQQRLFDYQQKMNVTNAWFGLTRNRTEYKWESGASYLDELDYPLEDGFCLVGSVGRTFVQHVMYSIDCTDRHSVICEKPASRGSISAPEYISNVDTLRSKVIDDEFENGGTLTLQCKVEGYVPTHLPIIWMKDGRLISTGYPPQGLSITLEKAITTKFDAGGVVGDLQGTYRCMIWNHEYSEVQRNRPISVMFKAIGSGDTTGPLNHIYMKPCANPDTLICLLCVAHALNITWNEVDPLYHCLHEDVLTYRVSILVDTGLTTIINNLQTLLLTKYEMNEPLKDLHKMLEMMFTLKPGNIIISPEIYLQSYGLNVLNVTVYYTLSDIDERSWVPILDDLNILHYTDIPGQHISEIIDRIEAAFNDLMSLNVETMLTSNSTTLTNDITKEMLAKVQNVFIRSTVACEELQTGTNNATYIKRSPIGKTVDSVHNCLSDGSPLAVGTCMGGFIEGAYWGVIAVHEDCPDDKQSDITLNLLHLSQKNIVPDNAESIAAQLVELTKSSQSLMYGDIIYASLVLENLASSYKPTIQVGESLVLVAEQIMHAKKAEMKKAQALSKGTTRVIEALEHYTTVAYLEDADMVTYCEDTICLRIINKATNSFDKGLGVAGPTHTFIGLSPNINGSSRGSAEGSNIGGNSKLEDMEAFLILPDEITDTLFSAGDSTLTPTHSPVTPFPASTDDGKDEGRSEAPDGESDIVETSVSEEELENSLKIYTNKERSRLTYGVYFSSVLFDAMEYQDYYVRNKAPHDMVISSMVNGYRIMNLTEPVLTKFTLKEADNASSKLCVWWDFASNNGHGDWSSEGCWVYEANFSSIICACTHLTNFAVLVDSEQNGNSLSKQHTLALGIISKIGLILSIIGLSLTVLTFISFREMRRTHVQKVHVNLAIALLCLNVVFLVGIGYTHNDIACAVFAGLIHYFLLAAFMWMLVEAVQQYLKFVRVLDSYINQFLLKAAIPSWGIPLVIIAVVVGLDRNQYGGAPDHCWVDSLALYFAVMLPIAIIIVINLVLYTLVIRSIACKRPNLNMRPTQQEQQLGFLRLNTAFTCFILLGITWIFGFIAIGKSKAIFQYLFCITNSMQGFLIFVLFTLRHKKIREKWWNLLCCRRNKPSQFKMSTPNSVKSTCKLNGSLDEYATKTYKGSAPKRRTTMVSQLSNGSIDKGNYGDTKTLHSLTSESDNISRSDSNQTTITALSSS